MPTCVKCNKPITGAKLAKSKTGYYCLPCIGIKKPSVVNPGAHVEVTGMKRSKNPSLPEARAEAKTHRDAGRRVRVMPIDKARTDYGVFVDGPRKPRKPKKPKVKKVRKPKEPKVKVKKVKKPKAAPKPPKEPKKRGRKPKAPVHAVPTPSTVHEPAAAPISITDTIGVDDKKRQDMEMLAAIMKQTFQQLTK